MAQWSWSGSIIGRVPDVDFNGAYLDQSLEGGRAIFFRKQTKCESYYCFLLLWSFSPQLSLMILRFQKLSWVQSTLNLVILDRGTRSVVVNAQIEKGWKFIGGSIPGGIRSNCLRLGMDAGNWEALGPFYEPINFRTRSRIGNGFELPQRWE